MVEPLKTSFPLLLLLVLGAGGCRPARGPSPARPTLGTHAPRAGEFRGLWLGVRRDEPQPGLRRAGTLLVDLRPDSGGEMGGTLELRGELGAARGSEGATVLCAPKPQAVITQVATISGGRAKGTRLALRLAAPEPSGEKSCGVRFPLATQCEGRGRDDGGLELACGGDRYQLRRISLTGTWVYDDERADRSGDTLVHRLRFHLIQNGDRLTGRVDDIRVHLSGDEQNYRCNGRLSYDRQARHRLEGRVQGLLIEVTLGDSVSKVSPCQGELKLPETLSGQWKPLEDRLVLKIGDDERTLWRRPPPAPSRGGP